MHFYSGPSNKITALEVGNNLTGINDNVRERGLEQKCFRRWLCDTPGSSIHLVCVCLRLSSARANTTSYLFLLLRPRRDARYCDRRVCISVRSRISKTACPNPNRSSAHLARGRGSVLLWRQCNVRAALLLICRAVFLKEGRISYIMIYFYTDWFFCEFSIIFGKKICIAFSWLNNRGTAKPTVVQQQKFHHI